jgi:ATP-dependent RNA helicase DDX24/MAK5
MGAAETGSGKTLAYGLPVLDYLLKARDASGGDADKGPLAALVLCPTRELALQVLPWRLVWL